MPAAPPAHQAMDSASERVAATKQFPYTVWGLTVWGVLTSVTFNTHARDLQCAELWCGVGSVWRAAEVAGHRSQGFDLAQSPGENILKEIW